MADAFRSGAGRILALLGDLIDEVHHIGSTSVPGLSAKPKIDIDAVLRSEKLLLEGDRAGARLQAPTPTTAIPMARAWGRLHEAVAHTARDSIFAAPATRRMKGECSSATGCAHIPMMQPPTPR